MCDACSNPSDPGMDYCWDCIDAAEAARNASSVPEEVLIGTSLGECLDCQTRFEYGLGTTMQNLDPCPHCHSQHWEKWGYRMPDDTEIPVDDVPNE